jgi:hypothetical protein
VIALLLLAHVGARLRRWETLKSGGGACQQQ